MTSPTITLRRFIPLGLLLIGLGLFFYFRLYQYISFSTLKANRAWLLMITQQHYFTVLLSFMAIYVVSVAISIPGAVILTLLGGFLFGPAIGTVAVIISATVGATLLFIATKTALGNILTAKAGPWVKKMEQGFQRSAFSYLLFLRFVPVFPFWLVNIVPAILNVRLLTFALATFIGIIPGSFVYVLVGNGLGAIFDKGGTPNLGIILEPSVFTPLLALGLLSLVPIAYKAYRKRKRP